MQRSLSSNPCQLPLRVSHSLLQSYPQSETSCFNLRTLRIVDGVINDRPRRKRSCALRACFNMCYAQPRVADCKSEQLHTSLMQQPWNCRRCISIVCRADRLGQPQTLVIAGFDPQSLLSFRHPPVRVSREIHVPQTHCYRVNKTSGQSR